MARAEGDGGATGWVERLVVFALVVLLVVVAAVGLAPAPGPATGTESLADAPDPSTVPEEFADARAEKLDSTGDVLLPEFRTVDGGSEQKTILIDPGRLSEDDLHELTRVLTLAGHEVLIAGPNLEGALARADAFLLFDPSAPFGTERINATREFVEAGGKVVIFGEPIRRQITASLFSVSITEVPSHVGPVANEFDIVFGRRYLYDTTRNDGNFKHVLAEGSGGAASVNTTALYTATTVSVANGTAVLTTPASTQLSTNGSAGPHTVAATAAGGDVLAIGDASFVEPGRHNVGENEEFIRYVLEFALQGDLNRSAYNPNPDEDEFGGGTDDGGGRPVTPPSNLSTVVPNASVEDSGTTAPPSGG